jgi:hypothetical protein
MPDDIFVAAADVLKHIDYTTLSLSLDDYEAARRSYEALCNSTAKPARKRRERKPSVASLVNRAEKTGKAVTSVTLPDGTTLTFGEASPARHSSWDDLETGKRQ